jgi:hypothetical protein
MGAAAAAGAAIVTTARGGALDAQSRAGAAASAGTQPSELLLTNGRIHTLDATSRVVRSALIRHNRVVAVGDRIARPAGARVVDLKGRTVVAGGGEPPRPKISHANPPRNHTKQV